MREGRSPPVGDQWGLLGTIGDQWGPVGDPGRTPIDPLQPLINPVDLFLVEPILLRGRKMRRSVGWVFFTFI